MGEPTQMEARLWLARQLTDETLSNETAFRVVAYHPDIQTIAAWNARAPDWQSIATELAKALYAHSTMFILQPNGTKLLAAVPPATTEALDRFRAAGGVL